MTLKLGMMHRVLEYVQMMTYFIARSNVIPYVFVWEKGKAMDFSETIVVYGVKLDRCS